MLDKSILEILQVMGKNFTFLYSSCIFSCLSILLTSSSTVLKNFVSDADGGTLVAEADEWGVSSSKI
jgi:hypothetical protein